LKNASKTHHSRESGNPENALKAHHSSGSGNDSEKVRNDSVMANQASNYSLTSAFFFMKERFSADPN